MYFATEEEMERLDAIAVKNGLQIRQMMELAGWHMLSLFKRLKISRKHRVCIIAGVGNKGGDGLAAARHLINNGWQCSVVLMREKKLSKDMLHHLKLLKRMKVPIYSYTKDKSLVHDEIMNSPIIIDALIGYHLKGSPRKEFAEVINMVNSVQGATVISYDIPSGVCATSGDCYDPCVKANITLSLALPKQAFRSKDGMKKAGKIYLGDIGIPSFLYNEIADGSRPNFEKASDSLIEL